MSLCENAKESERLHKEARRLFFKEEKFRSVQRFLVLTLLFMPLLLLINAPLKEWIFAWIILGLITVGIGFTRRAYRDRAKHLIRKANR